MNNRLRQSSLKFQMCKFIQNFYLTDDKKSFKNIVTPTYFIIYGVMKFNLKYEKKKN